MLKCRGGTHEVKPHSSLYAYFSAFFKKDLSMVHQAPHNPHLHVASPKSKLVASIAFPARVGLDQMQAILVHALEVTSDTVNSKAEM